jgi:hypothetical protein
VEDICNAIALRSDVHSTFDDRKLVFAPKESRWVVHFYMHSCRAMMLMKDSPLRITRDKPSALGWIFGFASFAASFCASLHCYLPLFLTADESAFIMSGIEIGDKVKIVV